MLTLKRVPPNGWLVLLGGGEFSFGETEEIDRFLLEKLPADRRSIAFLPTGSGSTEYAHHLGEHFHRLDASVELFNVPVYRLRDARRGRNADRIRSAGMVYVGGGVTNTIVTSLRGTVAEEAMREVIERGGVVAGIGAGACAFGAIARSMLTVGAPIDGLGWIPGSLVESGVKGPEDRRFAALMASPKVDVGIGIPERMALALGPDGVGTILGDGDLVILRKRPS